MNDVTSDAAETAQAPAPVDLSDLDEETLLALAQGGMLPPGEEDGEEDFPVEGFEEEGMAGDPGMVSYAAAMVGENVDPEKLAAALEQTYDHMGRVQAQAFVDETLKCLDGHVKTGSINEDVRSLFIDGLRLLYTGETDETE